MKNGLFGNTSMMPCSNMEQCHPTRWQWVSRSMRHDPCDKTDTAACILTGTKILQVTRDKECWSSPLAWDCRLSPSRAWYSVSSERIFGPDIRIDTGLEFQGTILRSIGKIPCMYLLMNDVPTRRSTARFSTTPNQPENFGHQCVQT